MGTIIDVVLPFALAFMMFSLGVGLTFEDFLRVAKRPRGFLVGAFSQIVLLPVVAFLLVSVWPLPAELAMGVMILAAAPGGATSNMLTAFAHGDVALSVSLTAIASLLCAITVPPILFMSHAYLFEHEFTGSFSMSGLALKLFIMGTVPVAFGVVLRHFAGGLAVRLESFLFNSSMLIFIMVLAAAIYNVHENLASYFAQAGLVTLSLNVAMILLAFIVAKLFVSASRQRITISIECGMQSGALAITVATIQFDGGLFLIPSVTYSLTMYLTAFMLIALFRLRAP